MLYVHVVVTEARSDIGCDLLQVQAVEGTGDPYSIRTV